MGYILSLTLNIVAILLLCVAHIVEKIKVDVETWGRIKTYSRISLITSILFIVGSSINQGVSESNLKRNFDVVIDSLFTMQVDLKENKELLISADSQAVIYNDSILVINYKMDTLINRLQPFLNMAKIEFPNFGTDTALNRLISKFENSLQRVEKNTKSELIIYAVDTLNIFFEKTNEYLGKALCYQIGVRGSRELFGPKVSIFFEKPIRIIQCQEVLQMAASTSIIEFNTPNEYCLHDDRCGLDIYPKSLKPGYTIVATIQDVISNGVPTEIKSKQILHSGF